MTQQPKSQQHEDEFSKNQQHEDEFFMHLALAQAEKAAALGEVPVGAVLVTCTNSGAEASKTEANTAEASKAEVSTDGVNTDAASKTKVSADTDEARWLRKVIAQAHNCPIKSHDPTAHAEIQVIRQAALSLSNYRLDGATLYVTLEPCTMCVGALVHARVQRVVFAASEPKAGALQSARALMDADKSGYFNHRFEWQGGVLQEASAEMLSAFFKQRRLDARG